MALSKTTLKRNGDHKYQRLEAIQTIQDGIKTSLYAAQSLVSVRKKFLLSGVRSEYKDLIKFVMTPTLISSGRN